MLKWKVASRFAVGGGVTFQVSVRGTTMKTITTLLLLLLASPAFAETWVCSHVNEEVQWGPNVMETFTRTPDNSSVFIFRSTSSYEYLRSIGIPVTGAGIPVDVVYENEYLLVLHDSAAAIEEGMPDWPTSFFVRSSMMIVIEKTDDFSYRNIRVNQTTEDGREIEDIVRGTCTVVE